MSAAECLSETYPMKIARCGRCRWWEGHRFRNNCQTTVSFAVEAKCANPDAPVEWANRTVHYSGGIDCPAFDMWGIQELASADDN
jgi:hypothetical protein